MGSCLSVVFVISSYWCKERSSRTRIKAKALSHRATDNPKKITIRGLIVRKQSIIIYCTVINTVCLFSSLSAEFTT